MLVNNQGRRSRTVLSRRLFALTLLSAMLVSFMVLLSACVPSDAAVGDSVADPRDAHGAVVTHEALDYSSATIGIIGPVHDSATLHQHRRELSLACQQVSAQCVVVPLHSSDVHNPAQVAAQALRDFARRAVKAVLIFGIDAGDDDQYTQGLQYVRQMGIPVVLIDPVHAPDDQRLFAAEFAVEPQSEQSQSAQSQPVMDALSDIINDREHPRRMLVIMPKA